MKLTVNTFDHFVDGQELQEYFGKRPLTDANIGYNLALNGLSWAEARLQHNSTMWDRYAGYFIQAEDWIREGKLYFIKDGLKIKVLKDGNSFCCIGEHFKNLQESDNYAFGETFEDAIENYINQIKEQ